MKTFTERRVFLFRNVRYIFKRIFCFVTTSLACIHEYKDVQMHVKQPQIITHNRTQNHTIVQQGSTLIFKQSRA